ncbi:hypothetical protein [Streptosporangium sp. NPDC006007]|uniref:hypothetical protein n=1 Tax=Streptosporangium sp. NPDC006007 TaxID=3154575 RepID=UPI0033B03A71
MSVHHVRVTEIYARAADHPWLTLRHVIAVESAPCLAPVLIRMAGRHARIACGRRLPLDRQCRNCAPRIVVTEVRRITA